MPLSNVRYPRLAVSANGLPIKGVIEAQITSNNHHAADRFNMTAALSADPSAAAFWSSASDVTVDLRMSVDGLTFRPMIQGSVDQVEIDPTSGTLYIEGRDLTARLIETRTQETFSNRTSSEIAGILAERHGLTSVVTPTTTPVGRYYQNEHDRITLDQFSRATTEWDLLVFLAQQEGFDVFVLGTALHFQPATEPMAAVQLSADLATELRLERALTLARDVEVTVKSWNTRQKNAFTQVARSPQRGASQGSGGAVQKYVYVQPNLTSEQALKLAQQRLAELSRHERVINVTMPGEVGLTPRSLITLGGTGTDFDQTYFVDSIDRRLSADCGFVQHLRCKNMPTGSGATPPADIVAAVTG